MNCLRRRRGRRAELVAEEGAELVVRLQGLGAVAARIEDLHQEPVAGLSKPRPRHERPGCTLGGIELAAADHETRFGNELERAQVDPVEPAADFDDPRRVLAGQEAAGRDVLSDAGRAPDLGPGLSAGGGLGTVKRFRSRLEVDPRTGRQDDSNVRASLERDKPTELREQCRERGVHAGGRVFGPDRGLELAPGDGPESIRDEVDEEQPPLTPRELVLDPFAVHRRDQRPQSWILVSAKVPPT